MDLEALKTFLAVAERRHFAKAAEQRRLSQPAVSRQVAKLEEELGVRLLNRTSRRVTLTVAGEALVEEARRVLSDVARARQRVHEIATGITGRVRLGASVTAGLYLLPPLLTRYRAEHPTFTLVFEIGTGPDVADRVARNELDMGFVAGRPATTELRAVPLVEDELVGIAAPASSVVQTAGSRRGRTRGESAPVSSSLPLSRLADEVWILREDDSDTRRHVLSWFERHALTPQRTMTLGGPDAIKRAVMAGLGIAIVSRLTVQEELRDKRLVELPLPGLPERRAFHLIDHPRKHHGAACQAMIALLRAEFEG